MNQDMIGRGGGHGGHGGYHHGHGHHGRGGGGGPWGYGYGPWDYGYAVVQVPCDPRLDPSCPWNVPDVYAAGVLPRIAGKEGHGGAPRLPAPPPAQYYGPALPIAARPLGRRPGPAPRGDEVVRIARSLVMAFEQGRTPAFQAILRRKLLAALQAG